MRGYLLSGRELEHAHANEGKLDGSRRRKAHFLSTLSLNASFAGKSRSSTNDALAPQTAPPLRQRFPAKKRRLHQQCETAELHFSITSEFNGRKHDISARQTPLGDGFETRSKCDQQRNGFSASPLPSAASSSSSVGVWRRIEAQIAFWIGMTENRQKETNILSGRRVRSSQIFAHFTSPRTGEDMKLETLADIV